MFAGTFFDIGKSGKTPSRIQHIRLMFRHPRDFPRRFIAWYRLVYVAKHWLRWLRIQAPVTRLTGYQYSPALDLIEIDITYLCNLRCANCNRSSAQAPEAVHMSLRQMAEFVDESLSMGRRWRRIRVLGGEPTLHPEFDQLMAELLRYKASSPETQLQVVSNGHGDKVNRALRRLPPEIEVENSAKQGTIQPMFGPFNWAPKDRLKYRFAEFKNGCAIMADCGMALTPLGYYPCAMSGGIDRVLRVNRGRSRLPNESDDMRELLEPACSLCGRFEDGHFVPQKLRSPLLEQMTSPSWVRIYRDWETNSAP